MPKDSNLPNPNHDPDPSPLQISAESDDAVLHGKRSTLVHAAPPKAHCRRSPRGAAAAPHRTKGRNAALEPIFSFSLFFWSPIWSHTTLNHPRQSHTGILIYENILVHFWLMF